MALPRTFRFGNFVLDPAERRLYHRRKCVKTAPKVFDLLQLLLENAGRLVPKGEIMDALWPNTNVEEGNLTNAIALLRKAVGQDAIETVSKYGYRFVLTVEARPDVLPAVFHRLGEAKSLLELRTPQSLERARDLFLICLAEDPNFAEGWAWLGRCYRFLDKFSGPTQERTIVAETAFKRALTTNPDLGCAHHFYTMLQADTGHASEAMARLLERAKRKPYDAGTFAGLVQVFRFGGLLDQSISAHERVRSLDPQMETSVSHTYFLRCDYCSVIESYVPIARGKGYLDLAARAMLSPQSEAAAEIRHRLHLSCCAPIFQSMLRSLLAAVEGDVAQLRAVTPEMPDSSDPEVTLYIARHFVHLHLVEDAIPLLERVLARGFSCTEVIKRDPWLSSLRPHPKHLSLLRASSDIDQCARSMFESVGGNTVLEGSRQRSVALGR